MSISSYEEYAKQNYVYSKCFLDYEFKEDLRNISTISKMIKEYVSGIVYDVKRIVNLFICTANVFKHESIPHLLAHKLTEYYWPIVNSFLVFINLPCINTEYIPSLLDHIKKEYYENI